MLGTLEQIRSRFANTTLTAGGLAETVMHNIDATGGEGMRTYTRVNANLVQQAAQVDALRRRGLSARLLEGVPISIKDLFDQEGDITTAGSTVLNNAPPAAADAEVVARLRAAGALITGRTNMTEFAFSALGLNPHHGTPLCPYDRATRRAPGGSSSGAAVSVSDDMAAAAIGSDTGGSVRIPAALCGLVGFKPSARRVSRSGAYPLADSLDSIGPIARSVACCALLDGVLSGSEPPTGSPMPLAGLRLLLPANRVLDDLDGEVALTFQDSLTRLSASGACIVERVIPGFGETSDLLLGGGAYSYESWQHHRVLLAEHGAQYDPRVRVRIEQGSVISAHDYALLCERRRQWAAAVSKEMHDCAAFIMPTTPMIAPPLLALEQSDELYFATNRRVMRNAILFNLLDGCAISLPCQQPGSAPVGLMLGAPAMADHTILAIALSVEGVMPS